MIPVHLWLPEAHVEAECKLENEKIIVNHDKSNQFLIEKVQSLSCCVDGLINKNMLLFALYTLSCFGIKLRPASGYLGRQFKSQHLKECANEYISH